MVGVVRNVRNVLEEVRSKVWAMTLSLKDVVGLCEARGANLLKVHQQLRLNDGGWSS